VSLVETVDDAETVEELRGEVAYVVYTNPGTGFGVVEVSADEFGAPRASGPLAGLVEGQPVRLVGAWREHRRYGRTFEATHYELDEPRSEDGLVAFLASDRFTGVGPVLAQRLVEAFGLEFARTVREDPSALARVRGVSPDLAYRIGQAWKEAGALAELVQRLAAVGLPASLARGVARTLGAGALGVLEANPYRLLEVPRVRWEDAEAFARAAGVGPEDERRLAAGAAAAHDERRRRGGHVALEEPPLVSDARRLLGVDEPAARRALALAVDGGGLAVEDDRDVTGTPRWYRRGDLEAEREVAEDIGRLLRARSRVAAAVDAPDVAEELTPEQRAAVRAAVQRPVSVLTGGPGTGKTRTVVEVVRVCEEADLRVACAAPTGRAAKRLEELTGRPATTVHRLLEAQPAGGDEPGRGFRFGFDRDRRLPHDLVIVDEWSMADLSLAQALLAAVGEGAHLMFVGDADQLPSVGVGAVLRDLLDAAEDTTSGSGDVDGGAPAIATTTLRTVHRQAAESRVVTLAHEINSGRVQPPRGRDGDVFAVPDDRAGVAARAAEIVADRAPAFFGCAPSDVQVLAPMYRGPAGVDALNEAIKERVNPAGGRPAVFGFHEGDRVVQTRNDAELDVANGDIGQVVATDTAERTLEVGYPHGTVTYDADAAEDLRPAWCLTVHKSQGGEWPVVVVVLDRGHRTMLWRELVYTAVTRAREGLLLLGEPQLLADAARRSGSGLRLRQTLLAQRLRAGRPA
jgi:exodeoxyribonuclease V alpha subunit